MTSKIAFSIHHPEMEFDSKPDNQLNGVSHNMDKHTARPEKVLRRLALNREAARKCRLRKKAHVQELENSKKRLIQLERELDEAQQQGFASLEVYQMIAYPVSNVAKFEMEYGRWLEEQNKRTSDLRNALFLEIGDEGLGVLVKNSMNHYFDLFSMKASAAKTDALYIMLGMWRTSVERFFFWIGGFRPSLILKVLSPYLEPLLEEQRFDIFCLRQSCYQAEDALSKGMEKLHQMITESISSAREISAAMENMEGLVRVLSQADHLRQETLQQVSRILTTRQTAKWLLVLGDYIQSIQCLSLLWSTTHVNGYGNA